MTLRDVLQGLRVQQRDQKLGLGEEGAGHRVLQQNHCSHREDAPDPELTIYHLFDMVSSGTWDLGPWQVPDTS